MITALINDIAVCSGAVAESAAADTGAGGAAFSQLQLAADAVVVCCLAAASVTDGRRMVIPDRICVAVALAGLAYAAGAAGVWYAVGMRAFEESCLRDMVLVRVCGALIPAGVMLAVDMAVPGAFGGGDIKLCAALGTVYGIERVTAGILSGILLSGFYGIILLTVKKKKPEDSFALGPFLAAGMVIEIVRFWW